MNKRKKKHTALRTVWSLVAVLAVVLGILLFREELVGKAKEGLAGLAMDEIVEKVQQVPELQNIPVKEIYNSLEAEDKQAVKEILADKMTVETVKDVKEYVDNKDMQGLTRYLQEKLSSQEQTIIYGLYEKYKDRIPH